MAHFKVNFTFHVLPHNSIWQQMTEHKINMYIKDTMIGPVAANFTSNAICSFQIKQCYMCSIKNSQFLIQSLMMVVGPATFSCFSFQYSKHSLHMRTTHVQVNK